MNKEIKHTTISLPLPEESFQSEISQKEPICDLNIEEWWNRRISNMQYFIYEVQWLSWASGDATWRDLKLVGNNGDIYKAKNEEIVTWMGATLANITKKYTIDNPVNHTISVKPWTIVECTSWFYGISNRLVKLVYTGSVRVLWWSSNFTLSSTNQNITFINTWNTDLKLKLQFATTDSGKPVFSLFLKLY